MRHIYSTNYLFTAALIPTVLLLGLIEYDRAITLNVYDTYFVSRRIHLSVFASLLLLIFTAILFLYDRLTIKTNSVSVLAYCFLTLLSVLVLYVAPVLEVKSRANSIDEIMRNAEINGRVGVAVFFSCAAFFLIQIWFAIILVVCAIRKIISR